MARSTWSGAGRRTRLAGLTVVACALVSGLVTGVRDAEAALGPNLVSNPGLEAQTGGFPTCFARSGYGTNTATYTTVTGAAVHSGTYAEQLTVTGYASGDQKVIQQESACAPAVTAGRQYEASVWYRSTSNSNALTVFKHTAATGTWSYFTDLKTLPATAAWAKATALTPVIPAGVDRISFGVSLFANGTLVTDDYSLNDTEATTGPAPGCTATAQVCANGRWNVLTYPFPIRAVHSVLLHTGKVLVIAGSGNDPKAFAAGSFRSTLWDPVAGTFTNVPTPVDLFCSGHVQLANGNVLVMGGNKSYPAADGSHGYEGLANSYVYDVARNRYQRTNDMNTGHWYPSATLLGNGDVLSVGGLNEESEGTVETELFSAATSAWKAHDTVPQTYSYWGLYPAMILMQDGRLFYSGSHVFGEQPTGAGAAIYDVGRATITDVPGLQKPQERDQSAAVLLPPAQDQRVMVLGGGNVDTNVDANRLTDLIDLMAPDPAYRPGPLLPQGHMAMSNHNMTVTDPGVVPQTGTLGKLYVSTVLLPDRKVLETGGALHNRADPVFEASLYDPVANAFRQVTPDPVARQYHSESFLLPDGRVASLGSNPGDGSGEMRISVYSPPYLFTGARPAVTGTASKTWAYGSNQRLTTNGAIVQAQLIKPAAVTHSSDPNQRLVDLPLTRGADGSYTVNVPNNPNLAPPGYYMLSVVRADRVPSASVWVKVGP